MILMALAAAAVLAAGDPAKAADIASLGWLAGAWIETKPGVTTRESWRLADGRLIGTGETVRAGKPTRVEHMTITDEAAGLTFIAVVPGQPPTPFVRRPGPAGEAVFENMAHDFPQRVIYRRCGQDLCARIEGMIGGKLQSQDWRYTRGKSRRISP